MPTKKKKSDDQQQSVVEASAQSERAGQKAAQDLSAVVSGPLKESVKEQGVGEESAPKKGETSNLSITTTEGNTLDRIHVYQEKNATMVTVSYGKINPDGKTAKETRAGMGRLAPRALTPEQSAEFQRLRETDRNAAFDYVARAAFPMHVDDAAFHQKNTTVNGRPVNYIMVEKLTAERFLLTALRKDGVVTEGMTDAQKKAAIAGMSPEVKEAVLKDKQGLIGKWQLTFGIAGDKSTRFYGILTDQEVASLKYRGDVQGEMVEAKRKDGSKYTFFQTKSVGAPLTMAALAAKVETRTIAERSAREASLSAAQKVDWSKFKLPEGIKLDKARYFPASDPDRVVLRAEVNGIEVRSVLSKNESTALRNGLATFEQAAAANKGFSEKLNSLLSTAPVAAVSQDDAVKAVVDRITDVSAKAFSPEQAGIVTRYLGDIDGDGIGDKVEELWGKVEDQLKDSGVADGWKQDAHAELKDLAKGVVRDPEQQALKL